MNVVASRRLVRLGLAGFALWAGIAAASMWLQGVAAGQAVPIQVEKAELMFDQRTNEPVVSINLTQASGRVIAALTQKHVGKPMALRIDGHEVMKPVIREPVLGGTLQVSGQFTADDARQITQRLSEGGRIEIEVIE